MLCYSITLQVKPEDVPLELRAHDVSTHSMTLSWSPPIRLNPVNYKVKIHFNVLVYAFLYYNFGVGVIRCRQRIC